VAPRICPTAVDGSAVKLFVIERGSGKPDIDTVVEGRAKHLTSGRIEHHALCSPDISTAKPVIHLRHYAGELG
jgi:hypothetical protein